MDLSATEKDLRRLLTDDESGVLIVVTPLTHSLTPFSD